MKIALIDPSLFTWPYDVRLAKGLTEIGHSVQIFGREPGYELPIDDRKFLEKHFYTGLQGLASRRPIRPKRIKSHQFDGPVSKTAPPHAA
jgi:hypothetical protein